MEAKWRNVFVRGGLVILLASPVRRWMGENPEALLTPYVREGMTVLEPGPGMGFFTLPLARMVGPAGRVVAVDIQARMLDALERRARKAGLTSAWKPGWRSRKAWDSTI